MHENNKSSFPLARFVAIAGTIVLAGSGLAWWAKSSLETSVKAPVEPTPPVQEIKPEIPQKPDLSKPTTLEQQIQIGWLDTTGSNVRVLAKTVTVKQVNSKKRALDAAFKELLAGSSNNSEYTSTIPEGTKLLGLDITQEGVKVNLSQDFLAGGGSAAMSARLAQVIYTASGLNETTPVWISVEGQPLETLGGEGITVSQPMTRQEFDRNFSL